MDIDNRLRIGICLAVLFGTALHGQGLNARITGDVRDEDGDYLPGVTVTAINVNSNAETAVSSEGKFGAFRFLALTPGIYQVSFEREGYVTYVASGIRLTAEQSFKMHITLRRIGGAKKKPAAAGSPEAGIGGDDRKKPGMTAPKGKFSLSFSIGRNYVAVADSNWYLAHFYSRASRTVYSPFETSNSGGELNAEFGYRFKPRWEVAVGLGLIRDRLKNNNLTTKYGPFIAEVFQNDLSIKTIPLQLVCRYWLGGFDRFSYCVYGAVQLHHASWKMKTSFNQYVARGAIGFMNMENENASGRGVGFAAGGRGEWQFYENIGLTVDLSARYAPLRNFSGERVYTYRGQAQGPLFQRGDLWFYEYYNVGLGKWSWELGIGGRPAGSGTRNVSRATVDFSGMAVRVGLLVRF